MQKQPAAESENPSGEPLSTEAYRLHEEDFLVGVRSLEPDSVDMAIADPPYGASTKATWNISDDHSLPGMGGGWDLSNHEWDRIQGLEGLRFALQWLAELKRVVRPTGSLWIHSTYHNSGLVNVACQMLGLEIINEVVWYKRNAFPNLSARRMTASHETILWVHTGSAKSREYRFNYDAVKDAAYTSDQLKKAGKQLRTVWDIPNNKDREELAHGKHPTQKPMRVVQRLFDVAGTPGGTLLVPFAGSGSEMVGALRNAMTPIGFEVNAEYADLARRRLDAELREPAQGALFENDGA